MATTSVETSVDSENNNANKQKRKAFTLQTKYDIIKKLQSGIKQSEIGKELGLNKSTICMIWKQKDKILESYEHENSTVKRLRKSAHDEVDKGLLKWFSQKREKNATITGAVLQSKAEDLGTKIEGDNFKCSRSWIERFKKRHDINAGKIVGEAASVNMETVHDWLENKWPNIRENYEDNNIFNADETGLFFKLMPNKSLKFRGDRCVGGKLSKERITVLVAANFCGTEKRRLLVIGKSQNPRCFRNRQLPVKYAANQRAWMTSSIFCEELREWDNELRRKKRKILLLVDNCPAHPEVKNLEFIKLVFMPPNTSSRLQPMDQGVIHSLKSNYRRILLSNCMSMDEDVEDNRRITLLDAVNFIHMAWNNVSEKTIRNCFLHAGFLERQDEFDCDDELPLNEWLKKVNELENSTENNVEAGVHFEEYVHVDENVICRETLSDIEIVASVSDSKETEEDCNEDEENVADTFSEQLLPVSKIKQNISDVRNFLQIHGAPQEILNNLAGVETYVSDTYLLSSTRQSKIMDYFKII